MFAQIPLAKAEILALFLESILYGGFVAFYIVTLFIIFHRQRSQGSRGGSQQRNMWGIVATLMLLLATVHLILDFVRAVQAYVLFVDKFPAGAGEYYADIADPLHVSKTVVYVLQTGLGDGVMIWRLYVIYNKSLLITLPMVVVLLANTAFGFVVSWFFSQARTGATVFQFEPYITTFFVLTMVINITCTTGIAYRIISRDFKGGRLSGKGSLMPVAVIVVESGAVYAASVLALLIAYILGSNGQFPALDIVTPIVGIVFVLIILQIYFQLDSKHMVAANVLSHSSSNGAITSADRQPYPLRSLAVHVAKTQDIHDDYHSKVGVQDF